MKKNLPEKLELDGSYGEIDHSFLALYETQERAKSHDAYISPNNQSYLHTHFTQNIINNTKASMKFFDTTSEQLQFILQNLDNGIIAQTTSGVFLYSNPAAATLLGFSSVRHLMDHVRTFARVEQEAYIYKDLRGNILFGNYWPWEKISDDIPQNELVVNIFTKIDVFIKRLQVKSSIAKTSGKNDYLIVTTLTDITHIAQVERQKDEFMSLASHELKTPITSMKVFTQALQRVFEKKRDHKPIYYLGKIEGQLNKLTMLVKEMLEVSRLQTGRLQLHQETFLVDEFVKEICEHMQFTTDDHMIMCSANTNEHLFADRERLGQVLVNLIMNAIKYSDPQTKISVQSTKVDTLLVFTVRDEGIGISKERQQHIFDRFGKNDDAKESTFPGIGAGLYIASEIIKRHNGTIEVNSKKNKGSTFTVKLPINQNEK